MGRFASRNLQRDFEDLTTTEERDTITFNVMVTKLKERYEPTKNTTIRYFEFHAIKQEDGEALTHSSTESNMRQQHAISNALLQDAQCQIPWHGIRSSLAPTVRTSSVMR